MKILVTGHKGFLGSNLIPFLREHTVTGWDLIQDHDIFDEGIEKWIKWADIIIHLAAETNVSKSHKEPLKHFYTNTLGTARVIQLCLKYRKRLIYPSTGAVRIPQTSPYAYSKCLAEFLVLEAMKYIPVTILRFFNIYGKNMNSNSGSIFYQFLKGAKAGKIEIYGEGKSKRDFINISDIVQIIRTSLNKKWIGEIVEIGSGQLTSIKELAFIFARETAMPVEFNEDKKEINWVTPDLTTLKRLYKRKLKTNLEKDIKEIISGWTD